jgi:uncharacterized protein YeaO (DUF488 family)
MTLRVVRLGDPRKRGEGPRLGTVRRPPRGVKKTEYASRDFYDLWFPELAPSPKLFSWARAKPWTDARWAHYARRYRNEMKQPPAKRTIDVLSRLSHQANFSVGCYCADESRCHRSVLKQLLRESGAKLAP